MRLGIISVRKLLLSVSLVALAAAVPAATGVAPAQASVLTGVVAQQASPRMTGPQLLRSSQRALSVVAATAKKLPRETRKRSAPLLKAIKDADRALKDLDRAVKAKDSRALSKALTAATRAAGRLNSAYKRSKLKSRSMREGMRSFNASWEQTQSRLRGNAQPSASVAKANGRRIAATQQRLRGLAEQRRSSPSEYEELLFLLAALDRAQMLNRSPEWQWLAMLAMEEAFGWYGGYYDYMAAYQPDYYGYYQDDYLWWNGVSGYSTSIITTRSTAATTRPS
jgi:hypothetical protein